MHYQRRLNAMCTMSVVPSGELQWTGIEVCAVQYVDQL